MALSNSIPLSENPQYVTRHNPRTIRRLRTIGFRTSEHTPSKQKSLKAALELHIKLFETIKASDLQRFPYHHWEPYCYIDLNAGRGQDEKGNDGSPLIFLELAKAYGLNYHAYLYEQDAIDALSLNQHIANRGFLKAEVRCQDHHALLTETVTKGLWQYGIVYADPSNAAPSWEVLESIKLQSPRMDILVNLACASYKRKVKLPDYVHLHEHLFALKKLWFVREPIGKHQWSILFGTDWVRYPEDQKNNYHSIESERGRELLDQIVYTHSERRANSQLSLL